MTDANLPGARPAAGGNTPRRGRLRRTLLIGGLSVLGLLVVSNLVMVALFKSYYIPATSMSPVLRVGDYAIAPRWSYGLNPHVVPWVLSGLEHRPGARPERGDIAVFLHPRESGTYYVKRVIGLPGDEIRVAGGVVHINGTAVPKVPAGNFAGADPGGNPARFPCFLETLPNGVRYLVLDSDPQGPLDDMPAQKVPDGRYFVMGDNRDNSVDSRIPPERAGVGLVPLENFAARASWLLANEEGEHARSGPLGTEPDLAACQPSPGID